MHRNYSCRWPDVQLKNRKEPFEPNKNCRHCPQCYKKTGSGRLTRKSKSVYAVARRRPRRATVAPPFRRIHHHLLRGHRCRLCCCTSRVAVCRTAATTRRQRPQWPAAAEDGRWRPNSRAPRALSGRYRHRRRHRCSSLPRIVSTAAEAATESAAGHTMHRDGDRFDFIHGTMVVATTRDNDIVARTFKETLDRETAATKRRRRKYCGDDWPVESNTRDRSRTMTTVQRAERD